MHTAPTETPRKAILSYQRAKEMEPQYVPAAGHDIDSEAQMMIEQGAWEAGFREPMRAGSADHGDWIGVGLCVGFTVGVIAGLWLVLWALSPLLSAV